MALLAALAPARLAAQPAAPVAPPAMRGSSLFVSPSGQPFRAVAGEPYPVVRWFAQADTNHDGVIDPFEMQAYENEVVPEILGAFRVPEGGLGSVGEPQGLQSGHSARRGLFGLGPRPPDDPDEVSVSSGAAPFELIPDPEPLAADDLAMDGHITLAEFLTAAERRFDRLDSKGLGYLTLAGLPKPLAQRTGEAPPRR